MIRTALLGAAVLMAVIALAANASDRGHGAQAEPVAPMRRALV